MKVVDENRSIRAIEEKISYGLIEELIYAAHNELKLIRIMKNWKPWEHLNQEDEDKEGLLNMLNITGSNPFPSPMDDETVGRHDKPARKPSAALHPEEQK